jgi:acetyltransferase-like isoleucine patch superfamily enzyme
MENTSEQQDYFVHETADVHPNAQIGVGTKIWNQAQVRGGAVIGEECIIGKNTYVDADVVVGNRVKIQNNCSLYVGLTVEDGVFIGPHVIFTNDKYPRAINFDGTLKSASDWEVWKTTVHYGASIGAGAIILPGINIGRFALIGSGAVVTKDVQDYAVVVGNPAKSIGFVCKCAKLLNNGQICETCNVELQSELVTEK